MKTKIKFQALNQVFETKKSFVKYMPTYKNKRRCVSAQLTYSVYNRWNLYNLSSYFLILNELLLYCELHHTV